VDGARERARGLIMPSPFRSVSTRVGSIALLAVAAAGFDAEAPSAAQRGGWDPFLRGTPIFLDGFETGECSNWSLSSSPLAAPDADEDLFGDELLPTVNCELPSGFVLDLSDCDDTDASVFPGAVETCNNVDDNCDGTIDEGLVEECYTGPAGTKGVGACHSGLQTCSAGQWGMCEGEVTPMPEICNGIDDNCDGQIDEGCPAVTGAPGGRSL
jgi:hypothetical protein